VATRVTEPRRQEAHVAPNPVPPVHQSSPHVTAPPAEVIEISSGDSDEMESLNDTASDIGAHVQTEDMGDLVDIREPLILSSSDKSEPSSLLASENEAEDDDGEVDMVSALYPAEGSVQISATAPVLSTKRAKKHWSQILGPSSIKPRSNRKSSKKFTSQNTRDIVAAEEKELRRKEREAKANRTGSGRTKKAEALADTSQMLDGVELPFRSSQ
jgi:hypothetical protein